MEEIFREQLSKERLYQQVVQRVEESILLGRLKPGQKLPSERELASYLGVSRIVVREAIKTLAEKGLVEILPGKGTFIAQPSFDNVTETLELFLRTRAGAEGRVLYDNLWEVRELLEVHIAGLAAERATPEHVRKMEEAVARMDEFLDSPEEFIKADLEFHMSLAEATRNPVFLVLINSIVDLLQDSRRLIFTVPGAPQRGQQGHRAVLESIRQKDPQKAREAMKRHVKQARLDIMRALKQKE